MNQCERLLELFQRGDTITSLESYDQLGITQLSTRLTELKELGYDIRAEWIKVVNRYGETCRVKRYRLQLPETAITAPSTFYNTEGQQSLLTMEAVSTMGGM